MWTLLGLVGIFLLTGGAMCVFLAPGREGMGAKIRFLVCGVMSVGVGTLCLGLTIALRAFDAFASSTTVAEVRCQWVGSKEFELTYVPVREGRRQAPKVFRLRGDQWSISGGVVKWHPWITALGIPSYHKPTRISGRYATTAEETAVPPRAVALDGELDRMWWWLYRLDPLLPFVEAAYGSAAFTYVNPALVFEVAVTPSGYLIRGTRQKPNRPSNHPRRLPSEAAPHL